MKPALLVVVLALLGLALVLFRSPEPTWSPIPPQSEPTSAPATDPPAEAELEAVQEDAETADAAPVREAADAPLDPPAASSSAVRLSGSVVVTNGPDGYQRDESGQIEVRVYGPNRKGRNYDVPVDGGRFSIEHPGPIEAYRVRELRLGDRETRPLETVRTPWEEGEVEVLAAWTPLLRVTVRDRDTEKPLHQVRFFVDDHPAANEPGVSWLAGGTRATRRSDPRVAPRRLPLARLGTGLRVPIRFGSRVIATRTSSSCSVPAAIWKSMSSAIRGERAS